MTITELGALGEFFGSILTLATLAYLAVQVRENTAQQKREQLVSIQHGQNTVLAQLQDARNIGGYARTGGDREPSIEDLGRALGFVVQYLNHFQIVHEFHRDGFLEEEQYQLWAGFAVAVVAPMGIRRWWDENNGKLGFHSEVRELIDRRLQDPDNPPIPMTELWQQFSPDAWEAARSAGSRETR